MSRAARVISALRQVGQEAVLLTEDGAAPAFCASIQPQKVRSGEDAGPLGVLRRRSYTLYGPPDGAAAQLTEGSRLASAGHVYRVLTSEIIRLRGEPIYTWATLEQIGEA